jgi:hypothetical protein
MKTDTIKRFIDAQNNLVVQHSDFSLRAIYDMAVAGSVDLEPHYQRRDRWKPEKQSALIESFILNVPVPPVYLSEDDFGRYSVIDGKQRLTAIRDFLEGTLRLKDLSRFQELEGAVFNDLPVQIQNALTVRPYIRVITLLKQTDPQLKYEVFLRLNTGGEKLLPQEIRNVAFSGPLNNLLFSLSSESFLWRQMKIKDEHNSAYRKMEDVEHVLRFFTIEDRWRNIGQVLSDEMDTFMRMHRLASETTLGLLSKKFTNCLKACENIWGQHAFHKPQGDSWREQFISPLFDAEMVATSLFSNRELTRIIGNREKVVKALIKSYGNDEQFEKSVSQSTNNPSSVKYRITAVANVLKAFI